MKVQSLPQLLLSAAVVCFGMISLRCLAELHKVNVQFQDFQYSFLPWPASEPVAGSMAPLALWLIAYLILLMLTCCVEGKGGLSKSNILFLRVSGSVTAALSASINPYHSTDFYGYIAFGREIAVHGQSPYLVFLNYFKSDPLIANTRYYWTFYPPIYGPFALVVFALPSLLGADTLASQIAGQKVISLACYFLSVILLWRLLRKSEHALPVSALTAVMLNPMMVFLLLVEAHLEVMVLPMLCMLLLSCGKPLALRGLIWSAALLTKFTTVLYAPLLLLHPRIRKPVDRRELIQTSASAFSKILLVSIPVVLAFHFAFEGTALFGKSMFIASLKEVQLRASYVNLGVIQYLVANVFSSLNLLDFPTSLALAHELGALLFPLAAAAVCWRLITKSEDSIRCAAGGFLALYATFLLTANYVQPWYYTLLLPAGAVSFRKRSELLWFCVVVSATTFSGVFLRMSSGAELFIPLAIMWLSPKALRSLDQIHRAKSGVKFVKDFHIPPSLKVARGTQGSLKQAC